MRASTAILLLLICSNCIALLESFSRSFNHRFVLSRFALSSTATNLHELQKIADNLENNTSSLSAAASIIRSSYKLGQFYKSGNNEPNPWAICQSMLDLTFSHQYQLTPSTRSTAAKIGVRLKERAGLAHCVPALFSSPPPDTQTLDNVLRIICEHHPHEALAAFNAYLPLSNTTENPPPITSFLHAITAAKQLLTDPKYLNQGDTSATADALLLPIVNAALSTDLFAVSLVVNALTVCREIGAWQTSLQIYSTAKLAAKQGRLKSVVFDPTSASKLKKGTLVSLEKLPSVVYGQALVTFAKGGAEAQSFQLVCDMLEEGVVPTPLTLDNIFMELSKGGSFHVMLAIIEQLQRYRILVSNAALNALLNACEKAGAYQKIVDVYSTQLSTIQLDEIGVGQVIKACDKLNRPDMAVHALLSAIDAGLLLHKAEALKELQDRTFAVIVKSGAADLATRLILQMELYHGEQTAGAFLGQVSTTHKDRVRDDLKKNGLQETTAPGAPPSKVKEGEDNDKDDQVLAIIEEIIDYIPELADPNSMSQEIIGKAIIGQIMTAHVPHENEQTSSPSRSTSSSSKWNYYDGMMGSENPTIDSFASVGFDGKLDEIVSLTHTPLVDIRYYNALVAALTKSGRALEAFRVLESYIRRGGVAKADMFTSAIYAWRYTRDARSAEKVMDLYKTQSPNTRIPIEAYNALLVVCAVSKQDEGAAERRSKILAEMEASRLTWSSHTYTALLMGQNDRENVLVLWEQLISEGKTPSVAAVIEVLKAAVMTMKGVAAMELLRYLWSRLDDASSSKDSVNVKGSVPVPDLSMCSLALLALGREGETGQMMVLLAEMRERGINPSPSCCSTTLSALEKAGEWKHAVNLLLLMQRQGLKIDAKTVNAALGACSRAGQWDMIVKLYDQMPTLTRNSFVPNEQSFTHVIHACTKANNAAKSLEVIKAWFSAAPLLTYPPSFTSISQVISSLEAAHQKEDSAWVFENMVAMHLSPSYFDSDRAAAAEEPRLHSADTGTGAAMMIDLHGFTIPVARASVRSALRQLENCAAASSRSLVIITGIGRNVLRPNIMEFLEKDFEPPLIPTELADNPGRLVIQAKSISDHIISQEVNRER